MAASGDFRLIRAQRQMPEHLALPDWLYRLLHFKKPDIDVVTCFEHAKRNGNDQPLDSALSNFLIWPPEIPPVIGSACLAADFNAAELCRRVSRVRKNS